MLLFTLLVLCVHSSGTNCESLVAKGSWRMRFDITGKMSAFILSNFVQPVKAENG